MTGESEAKVGPDPRAGGPEASTRAWQEFLSSELRCPVRVVYTRARRTPLQVRPVAPAKPQRKSHERSSKKSGAAAESGSHGSPGSSGLEVRMHSMFVAAPPPVHEAVVRWIRSGRRAPRACALLDRWIMESLERLPLDTPRDIPLCPRGRHHDLEALACDLIAGELAFELARRDPPRVTWGRQGPSRTRHSLRLGSFDPEGSIVRIHPVLDQVAVPAWFVRYVLFHELLHAAYPPRLGRGSRWIHHGAEFRRRERAYADYARAIAWEDAHMSELIRSARRTSPMRGEDGAPKPPRPQPSTATSTAATRRAAVPGSRSDAPAEPTPARAPEKSPKPERPALVRFFQEWLFPDGSPSRIGSDGALRSDRRTRPPCR